MAPIRHIDHRYPCTPLGRAHAEPCQCTVRLSGARTLSIALQLNALCQFPSYFSSAIQMARTKCRQSNLYLVGASRSALSFAATSGWAFR